MKDLVGLLYLVGVVLSIVPIAKVAIREIVGDHPDSFEIMWGSFLGFLYAFFWPLLIIVWLVIIRVRASFDREER